MKAVFILLGMLAAVGCGVKGDPVPPGTPAELGRGQPTYKKAAEEFAFPEVPPVYQQDKDKTEE